MCRVIPIDFAFNAKETFKEKLTNIEWLSPFCILKSSKS